jgi:hypothetical protein
MSNPDMELEEEGAIGGISEDEKRLLEALHLLGIKPELGSPEDVMKLLKVFGKVKDEPAPVPTTASGAIPKTGTYHYPKLSTFYGEEGKGEVTWVTFKYEVESLLTDKVFTDEQIMLGVRRALKGSASDKVRRLGPGVSVGEMLFKLDSDFGTVESRESVMRKFYSCQQRADEKVEQYASRLEELFDQAVKLKALKRTDTDILKEVIHSGLHRELKQMTVYQKEKIGEYEEFKKELRKVEAEMRESVNPKEKMTTKAAVNVEKKEVNEMGEVKELIKKLHERMDVLEKERSQPRYDTNPSRYWMGGRRFNRGRGTSPGLFRGRGRGEYRPQRPTSGMTFTPTCYFCGGKGHLQRNCTLLHSQTVCYTCNGKGHLQKDCPLILSQITCLNCKEKGHKKNNCPKL